MVYSLHPTDPFTPKLTIIELFDKENSGIHATIIKLEEQYCWDHFRAIFFPQLMNNKTLEFKFSF